MEPAQGLTIVMSSRSALFLSRGWLSKSAPSSVVMSIRNGFSLPFCSLALCRKGHVSSTTNWTLLSRRDRASAWWSTRLWVRELHPVFEQDMTWRRVVSCRQPLRQCVCVCVLSSHLFWTSDHGRTSRGQARFIHLLSAVLALIFHARRFSHSFPSSTVESNLVY